MGSAAANAVFSPGIRGGAPPRQTNCPKRPKPKTVIAVLGLGMTDMKGK